MLSLTANGVLLLLLFGSFIRSSSLHQTHAPSNPALPNSALLNSALPNSTLPKTLAAIAAPAQAPTTWGERQQLTYSQWLDLLKQEANITAERSPTHLSVLAGDSISLWFPSELLPTEQHWLF